MLWIFFFSFLSSVPSLDIIKSTSKWASLIYTRPYQDPNSGQLVQPADDCSFLDSEGGTLVRHISRDDDPPDPNRPKCCLWKKDNEMYLIIRGTRYRSEWVDNFRAEPTEDKDIGAWFHYAFLYHAKEIWKTIESDIKNHGGNVYFVGHSRGAAIAQIIHVYGKTQLEKLGVKNKGNNLYTLAYAPPPAMTREGKVLECTPHMTMFIHDHDIVPRMFYDLMNWASVVKLSLICVMLNSQIQIDECVGLTANAFELLEAVASDLFTDHKFEYIGKMYHLTYVMTNKARYLGFLPKSKSKLPQEKYLSDCQSYDDRPSRLSKLAHFDNINDHWDDQYAKYLNNLKGASKLTSSKPRLNSPASRYHVTGKSVDIEDGSCQDPDWMLHFEDSECEETVFFDEGTDALTEAEICMNETVSRMEIYTDQDFSDERWITTVYSDLGDQVCAWQYTEDLVTGREQCQAPTCKSKSSSCTLPDWVEDYDSDVCTYAEEAGLDYFVNGSMECAFAEKTCKLSMRLLPEYCEWITEPSCEEVSDASATWLNKGIFLTLGFLIMIFV